MATTKRILVTGARGFVGSHILAQARADGHMGIAAYRGAVPPEGAHLDVCERGTVDAAFRETAPSIVIHCAAYGVNYAEQDADRAISVNILGAQCVLDEAARHKVSRFIHIGSCFEYGSHDQPISEDASLNPTAIYGSTKAAATILLQERARALGIPLIVVRPFGVWGPGEPTHRLLPQVISACIERTPLRLTACEVVRDYLYVEDLAAAVLFLATLDGVESGTVVNAGTGEPQILRDFVLSVARILNGEEFLQFGSLPYRPTEMPRLVADVRRLQQLIGRRPGTPLREGVRRMVAASTRGAREVTDP